MGTMTRAGGGVGGYVQKKHGCVGAYISRSEFVERKEIKHLSLHPRKTTARFIAGPGRLQRER